MSFHFDRYTKGRFLGYGLWFWASGEVDVSVAGGRSNRTGTAFVDGSWNKAGSIWVATGDNAFSVTVTLTAASKLDLALYGQVGGQLKHRHLAKVRDGLSKNLFEIAPEAIFVDPAAPADITIRGLSVSGGRTHELLLKSCNRCGRYLPINYPHERDHLSFGNHCVAAHRRPCSHATFGRLHNTDRDGDILQLDYGYQLECRFCKKFEVNAAHNPQRTAAQMKEDGARRRAFEVLLTELYGGAPQLAYRHLKATELADDVWERFGRKCFNCGQALITAKAMHLDHTRPLARMWPLDRTATALCATCNSKKRDREPADFYPAAKLRALAKITGIDLAELQGAAPNLEALDLLLSRLDWFFNDFLSGPNMKRVAGGKNAGDLVAKALGKVFGWAGGARSIKYKEAYDRWRAA